MTALEEDWDRIHTWLEAHCPIVLASFGPPATDEQFREAERVMGIELPEEVKEVYRVHDGQRIIPTPVSYWPDLKCIPAFLYGEDWLGLEDMAQRWRMMKGLLDGGTFAGIRGEPRGPIRSDWWNPRWLPLTEDHSGYMRCLDLAPKSRGHVGQVIFWCHDSPERGVLARSLPVWIAQFADALERGEFTTVPDKHGPGLIRVRDL
jgi:cell wall assembly regulator SMI1